jgi:hypothetical protein
VAATVRAATSPITVRLAAGWGCGSSRSWSAMGSAQPWRVPQGHDGYAALVGLVGVLVISPIGLACSTICLVGKRHVVTFILCGVPTGLFAALWPLLADPAWTINRAFGHVS